MSRGYWEAICAASGRACGHRHLGKRQGEACARRLNYRLRVRSVVDAWYCVEVLVYPLRMAAGVAAVKGLRSADRCVAPLTVAVTLHPDCEDVDPPERSGGGQR